MLFTLHAPLQLPHDHIIQSIRLIATWQTNKKKTLMLSPINISVLNSYLSSLAKFLFNNSLPCFWIWGPSKRKVKERHLKTSITKPIATYLHIMITNTNFPMFHHHWKYRDRKDFNNSGRRNAKVINFIGM